MKRNFCTWFPDSLFGIYIGNICERHDRRYENTRITRRQSDTLLYREIKRKGLPKTAWFMWAAVRVVGWIPYYWWWLKVRLGNV